MEPTPTDEPTPTEEPISTEAPPPAEAPQPFADVVDQLLAERTGFYAVVISSPLEGLNYELNSGEPLQAASLYKLAVMVEIFRQREEGMLSFDDTVVLHPGYFAEAYFDAFDEAYLGAQVTIADLITPMITVSSNVAGWALLDLAGTENVNATMLSLGLTSTEIRWTPGIASQPVIRLAYTEGADQALNVTSAADMAMLFQMLLDGAVVSPQASNEMLEILKAQGINHFLSALLPPAVAVAHKTGSVDDVLHDTGIIYTPSGPVVVVVLTEGADAGEATEFMQQLGALVYAYAS